MNGAVPPKILAFAGSTREDSLNKKMVRVAADGARAAGADVTWVDLRDYPMPLYDGDLEAAHGLPEAARRLKALFQSHQGLLIASPEYNSMFSGVLKNSIDWISRSEGDEPPLSAFKGKTAVIMSASPGALGGLRGLSPLRLLLSNISVLVLPQQMALGHAQQLFDAQGHLTDEGKRASVEALGAVLAQTLLKLN